MGSTPLGSITQQYVDQWRTTFATYGWVTCSLVDDGDGPAVPIARSVSVGIPHPRYGVMRATAILTPSTSLTELAGIAHQVASMEYGTCEGLPHLYVGDRPFKDIVDGKECVVLGVLVFGVKELRCAPMEVRCAPMTVVDWNGMWLPYFESQSWIVTGWDVAGRVSELSKPFGWGCEPLQTRASPSSRESHAPIGSPVADEVCVDDAP